MNIIYFLKGVLMQQEQIFTNTAAFKKTIDNIFRGMVGGGAMGNVIQGDQLDENEDYAARAGSLAYDASDKNVAAGLLAMVLNAPLGGERNQLAESFKEFGVSDEAYQFFLLKKDGKTVNYRVIWANDTRTAIDENIERMPFELQIAMLAHITTVIERMNETRAPAHILEAGIRTGIHVQHLAQRVCPKIGGRLAAACGFNEDALTRVEGTIVKDAYAIGDAASQLKH
jgi:hypothetical protein